MSIVSTDRTQLAATAVLSGLLVAGTILSVQAVRRQVAIEDLKASIPNIDDSKDAQQVPDLSKTLHSPNLSKEDERLSLLARRAQAGDYDEELVQEQLTRTKSFLTPSGLQQLRSAFVVIVGLGGVGSHCAAALARSGVSELRLIDFDQVTLSSLNRHSVATLADVGTPKVHCLRRRLEAITPWVRWDCVNEIWRKEAAERLFGPFGDQDGRKPDYVVDAIDNIDSKVALLQYCHEHAIRVVSSMGAGCKSDPTRIQIDDIGASLEDPLSRKIRRRLKLLGITEGIPVAFSTEKPGPGKAALLPLSEEEFQRGAVGELGILPDFRARILPVLGTMPAAFGYVLANHVIMEITGYPHDVGGGKGRDKLYETVLGTLQTSEEKLARADGHDAHYLKLSVSKDDAGYLVDEVFRGRSVISGLSTRLALVRWRPAASYAPDQGVAGQKRSRILLKDLVCMTKEEVAVHEQTVLLERTEPEDVYERSVVELVNRRLVEEEAFERYR